MSYEKVILYQPQPIGEEEGGKKEERGREEGDGEGEGEGGREEREREMP